MIALDAILLAGIEERGGAHDVGADKLLGMLHRPVHMGLRRKVDHHIRLFLLEEPEHKGPVCNVALDKFIIRLVLHRLQVFQIACIGQLVQVDDLILWIGVDQILNHYASDKTGAAGNDDLHGFLSFPSGGNGRRF